MAELKPCPFCGGKAEIYSYDPYDGYQGNCAIWRVRCYRCGAFIQELTKERAIARSKTFPGIARAMAEQWSVSECD